MKRVFLDRTETAIASTIQYLFRTYAPIENHCDLSKVVLVTPSGRVRRALLSNLLAAAQKLNYILELPQITTIGHVPEMLYRQSKPITGVITQQLAWSAAARKSVPSDRQLYLPTVPNEDDLLGQLILGQMLAKLHENLASEGYDFASVAEKLRLIQQDKVFRADYDSFDLKTEIDRWLFFSTIEKNYLQILDAHNIWDREAARQFALRNSTPVDSQIKGDFDIDFDLILAGIVDMNKIQKEIFSRVDSRVTALIFAPESEADRFDSFGALEVKKWSGELLCPLREDQLFQVEKPMDQALCAFDFIQSLKGKYNPEEITIGVPDSEMVYYVKSAASRFNVYIDDSVGKALNQTPPYLLLKAVADFLHFGDFASFAALVRHPYVYNALAEQIDIQSELLTALDRFQSDRLPFSIKSGVLENLTGTASCGSNDLEVVRSALHWVVAWLADFYRPSIMAEEIRQAVAKLFSQLPSDPQQVNNLAISLLVKVGQQFESIPDDLTGTLSPENAIRLILKRLELLNLPDDEEEFITRENEELELGTGLPDSENHPLEINVTGWLELTWDLSPALVIISFNEGIVPQSTNANVFLPNQLRKTLGIMDNDRRFARDAYYLHAIADSRKDLRVIFGLRGSDDKPLMPSRLLFNKNNPNLASQAKSYFDDKRVRAKYIIQSDTSVQIPSTTARAEAFRWAQENLSGGVLEGYVTTISATKFKDYILCPFRFYLKHVAKLSPLSDQQQELNPASFGNIVHQVLQLWGQNTIEHKSLQHESAESIEQSLNSILDRIFQQQFPASIQPGVVLQKEVIRQRLRTFAQFQTGWDGTLLAVERKYQHQIQIPTGELMTLEGKIDRIDRLPNGDIILLDYKTADSAKKPQTEHRASDDTWKQLQLPIYRYIIDANRNLFNLDQEDIQVGYINISQADETKLEQPDWGESDYQSADEQMLRVMNGVYHGIFWPPTSETIQYDDFADYVSWLTEES